MTWELSEEDVTIWVRWLDCRLVKWGNWVEKHASFWYGNIDKRDTRHMDSPMAEVQ
jgi:hypothetical protein